MGFFKNVRKQKVRSTCTWSCHVGEVKNGLMFVFLVGSFVCLEAVGSQHRQCLDLGVFHWPASTSMVTGSSLTNTRAQVSLHTL